MRRLCHFAKANGKCLHIRIGKESKRHWNCPWTDWASKLNYPLSLFSHSLFFCSIIKNALAFSFKTKMTYLEWRNSILKMQEDTCQLLEKQHVRKVKVKKWKVERQQSRSWWQVEPKKKEEKKTKRGISGRVIRPFAYGECEWDPGGGGGRGGDALRARAPRGRSLPPSPLFLSPPPFPPKGGAHPTQLA